jgi:hypothetical protein
MTNKRRMLDSYFLSQIRKKGFQASENEVTRYFEDTGWRFYGFETMMKDFSCWREIQQKVVVEAD